MFVGKFRIIFIVIDNYLKYIRYYFILFYRIFKYWICIVLNVIFEIMYNMSNKM